MTLSEVHIVLVHSPLVGTTTWTSVAAHLRKLGMIVHVPALRVGPDSPSYWKEHVQSVAEALHSVSPQSPVLLVGHGGAGSLLPAVSEALPHQVVGYIFVDAILPQDRCSRLERFSTVEEAEAIRAAAVDGLMPVWNEEELSEFISDPKIRWQFADELSPTPLAVYEEKIPVFSGWPEAPCAYLHFALSDPYAPFLQEADACGWLTATLPGRHFHMLEDPVAVANAIIKLNKRFLMGTYTWEGKTSYAYSR